LKQKQLVFTGKPGIFLNVLEYLEPSPTALRPSLCAIFEFQISVL